LPGGVIYFHAAAEKGKLVCTVHDAGKLEPPDERTTDASPEHGRGLSLMRFLMDEVELAADSRGTAVRLSKRGRAAVLSDREQGIGAGA